MNLYVFPFLNIIRNHWYNIITQIILIYNNTNGRMLVCSELFIQPVPPTYGTSWPTWLSWGNMQLLKEIKNEIQNGLLQFMYNNISYKLRHSY